MPQSLYVFYTTSLLLLLAALLAACDTTISGDQLANRPPDTQLSVQDTSLVDNLGGNLLTSTVHVFWSGSDPDGFVSRFEFRYFDVGSRPAAGEGWIETQRRDSLVLLPIPQGESAAQVVFEVRAIDNQEMVDPDPARTVFPIKNSPPTLALDPFVQPADTSFNIFSFGWEADDPDGIENLDRIEVSFNDTTSFTPLPADIDFVTFVAAANRSSSEPEVTDARVYTGRGFTSTTVEVPGLVLNGANVLYVRSVDATDTTSAMSRYPADEEATWYVRKPSSRILFVNDYRRSTAQTVIPFHVNLLQSYLPAGTQIDRWNLSLPYATGSSGNLVTSDALPSTAEPTLRQLLAQWDYIYWVSTGVTGAVSGNNLPVVAPILDVFFDQGGKMMVHVPVQEPPEDTDIGDNAATLLLPLSGLPAVPNSVRLQVNDGASVSPADALPETGIELPPLEAQDIISNALPFETQSASIVPLYRAKYTARSRAGSEEWTGPSVVASISADRRVALFSLPLIKEQSGEPYLASPDGDPEAAREAVRLILDNLGFPGQ